MNAPSAAAFASSASDGRLTSTSSGCSGLIVAPEQVARGRELRLVGAQVELGGVALDAELRLRDGQADERRAVDAGVQRDRREDADDRPVAVADPDVRRAAHRAQAEPARGDRAEHDGGEALGRRVEEAPGRQARAERAREPLVGRLHGDPARLGGVDEAGCAAPWRRRPRRPRPPAARPPARRRGRSTSSAARSPGRRTTGPAPAVSRFVPRRSIWASRSAWLEAEMPSTATIEAIPIAMPTADSAARRRRVRRPMLPTASTSRGSRRLGAGAGGGRGSGLRARAARWWSWPTRVADDLAVAQLDAARERRGDLGIVRDDDERRARGVQLAEQRDDLGAGARVERARRLVGEDDPRVADERPRDRRALALAARQLRGPVGDAMAEADALERRPRPLAPLVAARRPRRADRPPRCRAPAARRAGRTAERRSPCAARAAPRARRRRPRRRRCRRSPRRRTSGGRACP